MTRDEALAYFTPHPLTKGPVMLDPEKMREAVAVLTCIEAHDLDIAGLELTEQICFDKVKKERDAYREALRPFAEEASAWDHSFSKAEPVFSDDKKFGLGEATVGHLRRARSLLSQPTEGE